MKLTFYKIASKGTYLSFINFLMVATALGYMDSQEDIIFG